MVCPSCNRPVATSAPRCLYCGAGLPREMLLGGEVGKEAEGPTFERGLVVLDLLSADEEALAETLGLAAFEAGQRARRGGLFPWRFFPKGEALRQTKRLLERGFKAFAILEEEVLAASKPRLVLGGASRGAHLALQLKQGRKEVDERQVLLVVRGAITREYAPSNSIRRARIATLEAGYRVHLHLRDERAPLEIDPGNFDFKEASSGRSSLLRLLGWVDLATQGVAKDDAFRHETPALSPASAEEWGPTAAASVLAKPLLSKGDAPLSLDNLPQFRFYSAWRGAVERARLVG